MTVLKLCPHCGKGLYKNELGDLVCLTHGIIELSDEVKSKKDSGKEFDERPRYV